MNEIPPAEDFKIVPDIAGVPEVQPEGLPEPTSGEKEAASLASGTLEEESKKAEHSRTERLRNHVHRAAVCSVWLLFFLVTSALIIVAYHYLVSERYCWLSDGQLTTVTTFLTSGAISAAAVRYMTARIA
jgi:hypothetical protein